MKIFFGAAIQGAGNREERAAVHRLMINAIKRCGCEVLSEHTTGKDYDATFLIQFFTSKKGYLSNMPKWGSCFIFSFEKTGV